MKRRRSATSYAAVFSYLATALVSAPARADSKVSIHYDSAHQLELARRLASELASEGYAVEIESGPQASPCEPGERERLPEAQPSSVWIRLEAAEAPNDTVVSICYLGALPFLQQVTTSGSSDDPQKLALSSAEALNGLRARIPPIATAANAPAAPPSPAPARAPSQTQHEPSAPSRSSASIGPALLFTLPDFPAAPGVEARVTLGVARRVGLTFDVFVPVLGSELASDVVTATARTTWLRVGPRFVWSTDEVALSTALLAGPALTWATGVADVPRAGGADVSPGAVVSLVQYTEYPARTSWFSSATVSASALLPGARVKLWDGEPSPRGSFPIVASVGLGKRWAL